MAELDDTFERHDLRVSDRARAGRLLRREAGSFCTARQGLHLPPGQIFHLFAGALLPLLPAKQRPTHKNDWTTTDADVACPDPNCSTRFRITRIGLRRFSHAAATAVPLSGE
jgi:uncharacterized repeat protein (TIGR04076 family)